MKHQINEVEITPSRAKDGLVAFASILLDGKLKLHCIGIYTKLSGGYRLTYPTKGLFQVFHPVTKDLSDVIEQAVIDRYIQLCGGIQND